MTPDSQLLCLWIRDLPEVTKYCRDLACENELLRKRVAELEGRITEDAARRAATYANSLMNRH